METIKIIVIGMMLTFVWFIWELKKANHQAKHGKKYSFLQPGQKVKWYDNDGTGFKMIDAEVIWQQKTRVRLKMSDNGEFLTVDRCDCVVVD